LRILPPLYPGDDVTAYIVVEDFGQFGHAFRETDLAEADLGTIVRNMFSGEYRDPPRVIAFNTVKGWSRDVSEQIAYDLLDRAYEVDRTLSVGAKRFIDKACDPGAKRPWLRREGANKISRPARRRQDGSTSRTGASILAR
jgi:hypothetical protein